MNDRERVIKGLHCCCHTDGFNCNTCPYDIANSDCTALMSMDILDLLKEQEANNERIDLTKVKSIEYEDRVGIDKERIRQARQIQAQEAKSPVAREMNDVCRILDSLKPCPFCGGKARRRFIAYEHFVCVITCADCGASLEVEDTANDLKTTQNLAIDKWNTRKYCDKVRDDE